MADANVMVRRNFSGQDAKTGPRSGGAVDLLQQRSAQIHRSPFQFNAQSQHRSGQMLYYRYWCGSAVTMSGRTRVGPPPAGRFGPYTN